MSEIVRIVGVLKTAANSASTGGKNQDLSIDANGNLWCRAIAATSGGSVTELSTLDPADQPFTVATIGEMLKVISLPMIAELSTGDIYTNDGYSGPDFAASSPDFALFPGSHALNWAYDELANGYVAFEGSAVSNNANGRTNADLQNDKAPYIAGMHHQFNDQTGHWEPVSPVYLSESRTRPSVSTTASTIAAANTRRGYFAVYNGGAGNIFIDFGATADANSIRIQPNEFFVMERKCLTSAVSCIAASGTPTVTVWEADY